MSGVLVVIGRTIYQYNGRALVVYAGGDLSVGMGIMANIAKEGVKEQVTFAITKESIAIAIESGSWADLSNSVKGAFDTYASDSGFDINRHIVEIGGSFIAGGVIASAAAVIGATAIPVALAGILGGLLFLKGMEIGDIWRRSWISDNYLTPQNVNDNYLLACRFTRPYDPLIFDLDGDGVETVGLNGYNSVLFDGNADGVKTATGWVGKDDALLVWDKNGNGIIDDGRELFGDAFEKSNHALTGSVLATDGFDALSSLDKNGDFVIDANDAIYSQLRLWQDKNGDGISQADEFFTLAEKGITSINLKKSAANNTSNGNQINFEGAYTKEDGSTGKIGNLLFSGNGFYREFTDKIPLREDVANLPEMRGSGSVRDLKEAMSLNSFVAAELRQKVSEINNKAAEGNLSQENLFDKMDGVLAA